MTKTKQTWNVKPVIYVLPIMLVLAIAGFVLADSGLVKFPNNYSKGVLYTTVHRGNITEDIYTDRQAIEAVKRGQPIPSGTVITLVDYREGSLFRYVVMEKRSGWGSDYSPERRNGEWEYQAFNADKTVNTGENLTRCFSSISWLHRITQ